MTSCSRILQHHWPRPVAECKQFHLRRGIVRYHQRQLGERQGLHPKHRLFGW